MVAGCAILLGCGSSAAAPAAATGPGTAGGEGGLAAGSDQFDPLRAFPSDTSVLVHLRADRLRASHHFPRLEDWLEQSLQSPELADLLPATPDRARRLRGLIDAADDVWVAASPSDRGSASERWLIAVSGAGLAARDPQSLIPTLRPEDAPSADSAAADLAGTGSSRWSFRLYSLPRTPWTVATSPAGWWLVGPRDEVVSALRDAARQAPLFVRMPAWQPRAHRARFGTAAVSVLIGEVRPLLRSLARFAAAGGDRSQHARVPALGETARDDAVAETGDAPRLIGASLFVDAPEDLTTEVVLDAESEQGAATLAADLDARRQQALSDPIVNLMGVGTVLRAVAIKHVASHVTVRLTMAETQVADWLLRLSGIREALHLGHAPDRDESAAHARNARGSHGDVRKALLDRP